MFNNTEKPLAAEPVQPADAMPQQEPAFAPIPEMPAQAPAEAEPILASVDTTPIMTETTQQQADLQQAAAGFASYSESTPATDQMVQNNNSTEINTSNNLLDAEQGLAAAQQEIQNLAEQTQDAFSKYQESESKADTSAAPTQLADVDNIPTGENAPIINNPETFQATPEMPAQASMDAPLETLPNIQSEATSMQATKPAQGETPVENQSEEPEEPLISIFG